MTTREEIEMEFNKRIPHQAPPTQRELALMAAVAEVIERQRHIPVSTPIYYLWPDWDRWVLKE